MGATVYVGARGYNLPADSKPLPPDSQPMPIENKQTICEDGPAQFPDIDATRVVAFTYFAEDPGRPGNRYWKFQPPDRWIEKSDIGELLAKRSKNELSVAIIFV
jgi:hypothetical protein